MLIAGVIALCVVLAILAFVAPRWSRYPQRGASRAFGEGSRGASKAPGKLGSWFSKPFRTGQKAVNKSAEGGRKGRRRMPL